MNEFERAVRLLSRLTNHPEGGHQDGGDLDEAKAFVKEHLVEDKVVGSPTTILSEETRYMLCCERLSRTHFSSDPQPDPGELANLLEELGVSLQDLEKLVNGDGE